MSIVLIGAFLQADCVSPPTAPRLAHLCAVALCVACACSKHVATSPPKRTLTIGITQEPDTLLMQMKQMNAAEHIGRTGALLLTVRDEHWQLLPWAAQRLPTPANGDVVFVADGVHTRMQVTWHLVAGLFWSDGHAVTADDFVFADTLARDRTLEIVDRTSTDRIVKMAAPDARTLVVTWDGPYAGYNAPRAHEALPRHIVEPLWRSGVDLKQQAFAHEPVLGGAFFIAQWSPGSFLRAKRNPYAVAFQPQLDEVVWRIIPQSTGLQAALLSGEIDAIAVIGLSFDEARDLQTQHGDRFDVHFTPALLFEHLEVNLDNALLKDLRVREALVYAANRAGIVRALFDGKQPVAEGLEPPGSPFYASDVATRGYDPAKARALLQDAGFTLGADGIRQRAGVRLSLAMTTTAGDKTREIVQELLAADYRSVGIELVVDNQPAKVLFGDTIRHRKFPGLAMVAWSKDPQLINEAAWRCDQIPSLSNAWRGQNYTGYCNPEVDALLAAMQVELDDVKRAHIGQAIERALAHDLPQLPLYFRVEVSVTPKGFVGWKPTGLLQSMAYNAHTWAYAPSPPAAP